MIRLIFALLLSLACTSTAVAQAGADGTHLGMAELRASLAVGKQTLVARQMALNPAEEASFWPIYDDHQKGLAELADRRRENAAAIERASTGALDEDDAKDVARDALSIQADEARLIERTHGRMSRALTPSKALKYLALELKLAALAHYDAAAALP